eukprot:scaffold2644_cov33-Tisochrysis_lutea.AAC.1
MSATGGTPSWCASAHIHSAAALPRALAATYFLCVMNPASRTITPISAPSSAEPPKRWRQTKAPAAPPRKEAALSSSSLGRSARFMRAPSSKERGGGGARSATQQRPAGTNGRAGRSRERERRQRCIGAKPPPARATLPTPPRAHGLLLLISWTNLRIRDLAS